MKTLTIATVFTILAAGVFAQPAFADHLEATISQPEGASNAACLNTNECFVPADVSIDVGGTVTWTNDDTLPHSIESGDKNDGPSFLFGPITTKYLAGVADGTLEEGVSSFNKQLTLLSSGEEYSFTFDDFEPGTYPYFCLVHPWMAGTVTVVAASGDGDSMDKDGDSMEGMDKDGDSMEGMDKDGDSMEGMDKDGDMMMEASATGMLEDGTMVKVYATEPAEGERMEISVTFADSEHVNYDLMVTQNGEDVLSAAGAHEHMGMGEHMTAPLPSSDPVDITITFQGYGVAAPLTGPIGEEVVFTNVVPEFGTVAMIILGVAITSIIAVTARSRITPRI